MGLKFAVITSVNRDDRPDGGAELFAMVIREIRQQVPGCGVEVLIPISRAIWRRLETVMGGRARRPESQYRDGAAPVPAVRLGARYERSLDILLYAKQARPVFRVVSPGRAGPGRDHREVDRVMRDRLRTKRKFHAAKTAPVGEHLPIIRYIPQRSRTATRRWAWNGICHVELVHWFAVPHHATRAAPPSARALDGAPDSACCTSLRSSSA